MFRKPKSSNILIVAVLAVLLSFTGCSESPSKEELQQQISDLEQQVEQLKNMPENLYAQAVADFDAENYEAALSGFNKIILEYPSSDLIEDAKTKLEETQAKIDEVKAAQEAAAETAKLDDQEKARAIIRISKLDFTIDSAGGVDVYINFVNNSDKTIKYAKFTVTPYNAVGDPVKSFNQYDATSNLSATGPFKKGEGNFGATYWSKPWYNATTSSIVLEKVKIEYMDGTFVELTGPDLVYIQY